MSTNSNQGNRGNQEGKRTSNRGFASMDPAIQREIASKGGKAAHEQGVAHEFNSEEAREAGRKGGEAVSRDRQHMSEIGRKGGEASRGGGRRDRENNGNSSRTSENGTGSRTSEPENTEE